MHITINGENHQLNSPCTLECLLQQLGFANKKIVVELNREIVPAKSYGDCILKEHDQLEIVQAIGGG